MKNSIDQSLRDLEGVLEQIKAHTEWQNLKKGESRLDSPLQFLKDSTEDELELELGRFWQLQSEIQVQMVQESSKNKRRAHKRLSILITEFWRLHRVTASPTFSR